MRNETAFMFWIGAAIIVVAILVFGGWRTVADAQRDEQVRQELKWAARDAMRLEDRVNDLDARVKALEAR